MPVNKPDMELSAAMERMFGYMKIHKPPEQLSGHPGIAMQFTPDA